MRHRIAVMTATAAISFGAIATGTASAEAPSAAVAATAAAAPEHVAVPMAKRGLRCVAAGVRTLIELGILRDAALQRVDYSVHADPVNGPIFTTLPRRVVPAPR